MQGIIANLSGVLPRVAVITRGRVQLTGKWVPVERDDSLALAALDEHRKPLEELLPPTNLIELILPIDISRAPAYNEAVGILVCQSSQSDNRIKVNYMGMTRQAWEHRLLFARVMEAIEDYIASKNLPPGAKLPSEREFANLFNCSRTAVRESLKSLASIGVVDILVGKGAFITEFGWSNLIQRVFPFMPQEEDCLAYLTEARITIEPAIIGLVIDKVNDDDLARLEEIVRKLELAETFEGLVAIDIGFHQMLMGITRNPLLTEFSKLLKEYFAVSAQDLTVRSNTPAAEKFEAARERSVSEHWKLYEAVRKRDKQQAQDLLIKHILWRSGEIAGTEKSSR